MYDLIDYFNDYYILDIHITQLTNLKEQELNNLWNLFIYNIISTDINDLYYGIYFCINKNYSSMKLYLKKHGDINVLKYYKGLYYQLHNGPLESLQKRPLESLRKRPLESLRKRPLESPLKYYNQLITIWPKNIYFNLYIIAEAAAKVTATTNKLRKNEYLEIAVNLLNTNAIIHLAEIYKSQQKYFEMEKLYFTLIQNNNILGYYKLGKYFQSIKSYKEMKSYYKYLIIHNYNPAIAKLGNYYQYIKPNFSKMIYYYDLAIANDNGNVYLHLGYYYLKNNLKLSKQYFILTINLASYKNIKQQAVNYLKIIT
jgi:hypothetical protein